jgi:hypothetical protein
MKSRLTSSSRSAVGPEVRVDKCPRCRAKYNPSYTVECSKCGALLAGIDELPEAVVGTERSVSSPTPDPGRVRLQSEGPSILRRATRRYFEIGAPFLGWIVLGVLALGGTVVTLVSSASRDESGVIVDGGDVGVFEPRIGDCLNLRDDEVDADVVTGFVGVPCSDPHSLEVFAAIDYPAIRSHPFPGREVIMTYARENCVEHFEGYAGVPFVTEPVLDVSYFAPEEQGWIEGDREITCVLIMVDDSDLVGSMNGMGTIQVQSVSLGCYDMPDEDVVFGLRPRSCDDPHDAEVYSIRKERLSTSAGFDDERLVEFGDRLCQEDLDVFLGSNRSNPDLTWSFFYPSPEGWAARDRNVICFVMRSDETKIRGSIQEGGGRAADA